VSFQHKNAKLQHAGCVSDAQNAPELIFGFGYTPDPIGQLKGCQTVDKVGGFCLPVKLANRKLLSVMQESAHVVGR